jgi:hypothetical protein
MMATWTQGTGDEFIEISKLAWAKGVSHPAISSAASRRTLQAPARSRRPR